ncbi:MAG: chorismate synthase [Chloroflexi bacterium]|nr:chorismate synthase [Chloroflexota bacterium]
MVFNFLTAGESHGKGLTSIIEGMVAGLPLAEADIDRDLARRQGGYGRGGRMKIEHDHAEILSGVRHGQTIGSPISLFIRNRDWENWQEDMSVAPVNSPVTRVTRLRPGHADMAGTLKYGFNDVRPVLERASARETAARVAAGSVARKFLDQFGIAIHSHVIAIGGRHLREAGSIDWEKVEASPVRCTDPEAEKEMKAIIDRARGNGDTVGGVFEVVADGVPPGLGSHVHWDRKLSTRLVQAIGSINAVKGIETGAGFAMADLRGSQAHDIIVSSPDGLGLRHTSNRAGGVEGGMSNGEPIIVRAAVKPIATLTKPLPSVDLETGRPAEAHVERSDICVVPAAGVVGEAMVAIVLADAVLEKFGGDSLREVLQNYHEYLKSIEARWTK